jgi:hypothetical protein
MNRIQIASILALALLIATAVPAFAAGPTFEPAIYADGVAWGTKGTTTLPAPNGHNDQSFDGLFVISDGVKGQLPVSEAGPKNPAYNGGRWSAYSVTWEATATKVLVTSYAQLMDLADSGAVTIESAHSYFQCPLLRLH